MVGDNTPVFFICATAWAPTTSRSRSTSHAAPSTPTTSWPPSSRRPMFGDTARAMGGTPLFVKFRHTRSCNADYAAGVAAALSLDLEETLASLKNDPMCGTPLVALPV